MRTFHSGWVAKKEVISLLVSLVSKNSLKHEIQNIKLQSLHMMEKLPLLKRKEVNWQITLEALERQSRENTISQIVEMNVLVKKGDNVEPKQIIAKWKDSKQKYKSPHAGRVVKITDDIITIEDLVPEVVIYSAPAGRNLSSWKKEIL
jgi:hypothetical protein